MQTLSIYLFVNCITLGETEHNDEIGYECDFPEEKNVSTVEAT